MIQYLETVNCNKVVVVDTINNISSKISNGVTSATYTSNGLIINGTYYWTEEVTDDDGNTETVQHIINWESSSSFTWSELNTLYDILNVQYPTDPTYEQRMKADIAAGLLYVTQQDGKFGTVASDWVAA